MTDGTRIIVTFAAGSGWHWYGEEPSGQVIAHGTDFHPTPAEAWADCMAWAPPHLLNA